MRARSSLGKEPPEQLRFSQDGNRQHRGMFTLESRAVTVRNSMGPRQRAKMRPPRSPKSAREAVESEKTLISTAATATSNSKCFSVNRGTLAALIARDPAPCELRSPPIVSSVSTPAIEHSLRFHRPSSTSPELHSQKAHLLGDGSFAAVWHVITPAAYLSQTLL